MITIVAIGKKHEDWVEAGIERYKRRLKHSFSVRWILLPHSTRDGMQARQDESERILSRLSDDEQVVLLDETGSSLDSPAVSKLIEASQLHSRPIVFVIGGAYGVSPALTRRADTVLSLSKLVFPHQLVRLILLEQIYRSQEISRGSGYHHA